MNTETSEEFCRSMMEIKIKVTKEMYKSFDSYERKQRWILKHLMECIKRERK